MASQSPTVDEHDIDYLALKHGTSFEQMKELSWRTGSRSRVGAVFAEPFAVHIRQT